ncbi:PP-loop family-domain-containing protein [Protomyces lactucae-debilis]|uniref:tRNA(Ile)-lysidine synthetase n=1 Tax=Protomyces lactucae-debilis TaxID=2754530 RepID=A0A1Y2FLG5_PROLT|nr:PP-loop family-domain-containing protein [Protomyces lactucae-debilis]ORY84810.1 PP-loop family-domain-containing protein [Protomyces lactucae-debilis]
MKWVLCWHIEEAAVCRSRVVAVMVPVAQSCTTTTIDASLLSQNRPCSLRRCVLPARCMYSKAPCISALEIDQCIRTILQLCPTTKLPRIALALSGGVDSLALLLVLSQLYKQRQQLDDVVALTVDHALRAESSSEAAELHARMEHHGIRHEVLKLPDTISEALLSRRSRESTSQGVEKLARQGRFEALTAGCLRHNAKHLFLAHHADDQAETVLMRLAQGASWRGMSGIRPLAWNPASGCSLHGASSIRLVRPFLTLPKARLRATCEAMGEAWYEDASNADTSLTMRNAVRKLLQTPNMQLPVALQPTNLVRLSSELQIHRRDLELRIAKVLGRCDVSVDEQIGMLSFRFAALNRLSRDAVLIALQGLAEIVTPSTSVKLESMQAVFTLLCDAKESQVTAAGLVWQRKGDLCRVWRQPWQASEEIDLTQEPILWDRRFWISGQGSRLRLRCLRKSDMTSLRHLAKTQNKEAELDRLLKRARGALRFTLPVIIGETGQLLALPSASLAFDSGIEWTCNLAHFYKLNRLLEPERIHDMALN